MYQSRKAWQIAMDLVLGCSADAFPRLPHGPCFAVFVSDEASLPTWLWRSKCSSAILAATQVWVRREAHRPRKRLLSLAPIPPRVYASFFESFSFLYLRSSPFLYSPYGARMVPFNGGNTLSSLELEWKESVVLFVIWSLHPY